MSLTLRMRDVYFVAHLLSMRIFAKSKHSKYWTRNANLIALNNYVLYVISVIANLQTPKFFMKYEGHVACTVNSTCLKYWYEHHQIT